MTGKKRPSSFEELRHTLETEMLQASSLQTKIEQQDFVKRTFTNLYKARHEKLISQEQYVSLINLLAAYRQGAYNDYIDMLAGAAQFGMLDVALHGESPHMTPEAARQRSQAVTDLTGIPPIQTKRKHEEDKEERAKRS